MSGLDIEAIRQRSELASTVEIGISRGRMSDDAPFGSTRVDITPSGARALHASAADVPLLLAEIERLLSDRFRSSREVEKLREWNDEIKGERDQLAAALIEEQTVHAKTFDNFEAHSEACLEERTRQLDRYARLEFGAAAEAKHLRAELAHQRRRADTAEADLNVLKSTEDGEAVVLRGERDQARAALADALQVIADLRGAP